MATFDEFYASLDPDVGIRGKQFEKFVKWFLKTDPIWATQVDEVWLWNEYPYRWGADCGIDLIFTHKNGNTWAVQSKCVSPNNDIKKSEIDSFLSESNDSKIDGRLLIASTDGIGKNAQQVIYRQEKQVVCFLLEQFRQSEIEFPFSMKDLNKGKRKAKKIPDPRHQIEAIEKVSNGLKNEDRGQVLMACGTGKTLTSLWIKEKIKAKQVLVLVPSLNLLSQTLKEWNSEANDPFKWICVCSDKSVAKDKSEDQWISNTAEIGVPVTTDSLEVKYFLDESGSKVVFATYQSAQLIVEAQEHHDTNYFDLVIADEAHRCAGKVSSSFGCVLDENKIKASKRLFFTATPRVLSKQIKTKSLDMDFEIASMDDHSVFGKVLYELKFSEAIDRDLLSDYQVAVIGIDDEMIKQKIVNRKLIRVDDKTILDAEMIASQIAITKAIKDYDLKRVITFHNKIKNAKNFSESFDSVISHIVKSDMPSGKIYCDHISGKMKASERNQKLYEIKNLEIHERRIISNAKCLSEGVDVPTLSGIAFINPKQSQIDIIQAVGRAIRKSDDKSKGIIVIPLYISKEETFDEAIFLSNFKKVWQIITALKCQDDLLMESVDQLRIQLGEIGSIGANPVEINKIIFDIPEKINANFSKSITTYLVENTSSDWFQRFGELRKFFNKNKHPNITYEYSSTLYNWGIIQRTLFKKGQLTKEKIKLLNEIKFVWDTNEFKWQENYQLLKEFFIKEGHSSPTQQYSSNLSRWVIGQRKLYKSNSLSTKRISLLESINFQWDPIEEQWQKNYQLLKDFYLKEGHTDLKDKKGTLHLWTKTQRSNYFRNKLSKEKIFLLEKIKFIWDPIEEQWRNGYKQLKDFYLKKGHSLINIEESSFLHRWSSNQRTSYKKNKLTKEKINLLNEIKFIWDLIEFRWQENYQLLKDFYLKEGHSKINYEGYSSFQGWCNKQREHYKKGTLSSERIDLLEQVEFIWDPIGDPWQKNYQLLKEFFIKEGHSNVLAKYPLGAWCTKQRNEYKKNKLPKEKIKLLEEIKFIWDPIEFRWQENYQLLKEFFIKEGHSSPTQQYSSKLSAWVIGQRKLYKDNSLSKEKIKLLEEIKFVWYPIDEKWQRGYNKLKEFYLKEGHSSPSLKDDKYLGTWCLTQRKAMKSKKIDSVRITLLDEIKFVWDMKHLNWIETFNQLKKYQEKNGNLLCRENTSIYQKVRALRNSYRQGFLSKEKINLLESIGFIWNEKDYEWNNNYEKLKKFSDKYGTIKDIEKEHPELVNWIRGNRRQNSSYQLDNLRRNKLNGINGWIWK